MVSIGAAPNMMVDFQSYAGPGDKGLRNTEIEGYQPVSRIGEVAMNAFIDSYEFTTLGDTLTQQQMKGGEPSSNDKDPVVEFKPHFHECGVKSRPCDLYWMATARTLLTSS